MVKKLVKLLRDWNDLLILAPSALILFIVGGQFIRALDPTAAVVELGVLSILNWNLFLLLLASSVAYYIYKISFGDYFEERWAAALSPFQEALINVILWLSTFSISAYILLRNL
jgi:hypothetical protein